MCLSFIQTCLVSTIWSGKGSSGCEVVTVLACEQEVRGSIPRLAAIRCQRLVISYFQVAIWLKDR